MLPAGIPEEIAQVDLWLVHANATLLAALGLNASGVENESVLLPEGLTGDDIKAADTDAVPRVDEEAISELKFSVALPPDLAVKTLGERWLTREALGRLLKPTPWHLPKSPTRGLVTSFVGLSSDTTKSFTPTKVSAGDPPAGIAL